MWPQVALTHHAKLSKRIEPYPVYLVNLAILSKAFAGIITITPQASTRTQAAVDHRKPSQDYRE